MTFNGDPLETSSGSKTEKESTLQSLVKIYYDQEDNIQRIIQEDTEGKTELVYPMQIECGNCFDKPKYVNYIPDFKEGFFKDRDRTEDPFGVFHTVDLNELNAKTLSIIKSPYDKKFVEFLSKNVDGAKYTRFLLEQLAVKSHIPDDLLTMDRYRLATEWPRYYPKSNDIQEDRRDLPGFSFDSAYRINRLICIFSEESNNLFYSFRDSLSKTDVDICAKNLDSAINRKESVNTQESMVYELLEYYGLNRRFLILSMRDYVSFWDKVL